MSNLLQKRKSVKQLMGIEKSYKTTKTLLGKAFEKFK